MRNPVEEALTNELRKHGIKDWRIEEDDHKHPRLIVNYRGQEVTHVFPKTSSDWRAPLNAVSQLRRQLGITHLAEKSRRGKDRSSRPAAHHDRIPSLPEHFTIKPDPLAVLLQMKFDEKVQHEAANTNFVVEAAGYPPSGKTVALRTPWLGRRTRYHSS